ncbi:MAG: hypothetical protein AB3N24_24740 [Leisingera sp.]
MAATKQEIYSVAQRLENSCRVGQAAILRTNAAKVVPGSAAPGDRNDLDAQRWHISILGLTGSGFSHREALKDWIRSAKQLHRLDQTRRATDGRVDCPYGGQGSPEDAQRQAAAPETLPQAMADPLPRLELAGGASSGPL